MSKILSIIIPTYNMEELLPRCLDSLVAAGVNAEIEAIVVNDGSRDNSLKVAKEYESKYPECITVIDKPNGNYGSTINAALPKARGKYVKILDSDDWFDSSALAGFVNSLRDVDTDVAVTHFKILYAGGKSETAKYNLYGKEPYEYGHVYELDHVLAGGYIRFFLMHALAYRTELLLEMNYRQTEGISYTDTQWCSYPLFNASNIVFFDIVLYQYNMAREGQTMEPGVIVRSLDQLGRMTFDMFDFYTGFDKSKLSEVRRTFLAQYFRNRARILAKSYLYDMPRESFDADEFDVVDSRIREFIQTNALESVQIKPENKLLPVDFYAYWCRHHRRPSAFLESVNHLVDIVARKVYLLLFRH